MTELATPLVLKIAARLVAQKQTVAVAESSGGGLISAALLAVPGASAYFLGGGVIYTAAARTSLLGITNEEVKALRMKSSTPEYAALLASRVRERHNATWGIGETGAAGPTGNRYGNPAGHTAIAISGPQNRSFAIQTGSADREANMWTFAARALEELADAIGA